MERIPLFPLSAVVFPESGIPLHIFEERYKTLVNNSLKNQTHFGIVLSIKSKLKEIGTAVYVSDLIKRYDDGKMDIIVSGTKRFKINSISDGEAPFYIANVDFIEDINDILSQDLLESTIELFNEIANSVSIINIDKLNPKDLPNFTPSYYIAQKCGLTLEQKQEVLEKMTENQRLLVLRKHLQELLPMVREAETISKIVKYDGYYKPKYFRH